MKTCVRCNITKPLDGGYYKNKRSRGGYLTICRDCVNDRQRAYVARNLDEISRKAKEYHRANRERLLANQKIYKEKHRRRIAELKREKETGFTPAMFAQAIEHQGGKCPICLCTLADLPYQQQHADHCHATGQPRGVLCQKCNTALGKFKDDPDRLRRAIAYLDAPTTLLMLL